jgi:glycerol-3-phosphate O-acyltransferase
MGSVDETPWPGTGESVALLFADTPLEHDVLTSYLKGVDGQVEAVPAAEPDLVGARLSGHAGDPEVVPLRVAWVERLGGALKMAGPLAGRLQDAWLRRRPDGARVVVGEPARVGDLRRRFEAATGGGDAVDFGEFVARQGALALERASRRLTGRPKVPRLVVEEIEASARFKAGVAAVAAELGRAATEVAGEAAVALAEMAASQSPVALAAWRQLERVAGRAYRIDVDTSPLDELRRLGRQGTLVFLPSHRSYMDPLILRSALDEHGFPPNHVLGGINVAFWPVGPIGKRAGLVFIRRRVRDDPVYRFVLREYVSWLVRKRFNLEWYIEGGRTRTGKLRPPRLGLLAYLVEAFRDMEARPGAGTRREISTVHLVPVAIVYDQLYEVRTMAAEEHGAEKRPESLGWALGYARAQGKGLGAVHVRFGEPLSLAEGLEASDQPVEKLAFEVCHRINRATPLTANALISLALLGVDDRALTVAQTAEVLAPLLDYLARRGLEVAGDVDLATPEGVRATLDALTAHGVLRQGDFGPEPIWTVARPLEAAFYRNGGIHFFVNRAIVEMVALRVAEEDPGGDTMEGAWAEALRLRDMLKFEFFFARKRDFATELAGELALYDSDWTARGADPGQVWKRLTASGLFVAHRVLRSFLEAYLVVAERLVGAGAVAPEDEDAFVSACVGVSRQWHAQGRLHSPESASKELFRTGWRLAANRGLLGDPAADAPLAGRRAAFAAEVAGALTRVERVGSRP